MPAGGLLSAVATGVTVCCAVVVTALLLRQELAEPAPREDLRGFQEQDDWRSYAVGRRIWPDSASVAVTVFMDYQCSACRVLEGWLQDIRELDTLSAAIVYRHLPLRSHAHAFDAAVASECAAAQGRFLPMNDILFAKQDSLGAIAWEALAERAEVQNVSQFSECLRDSTPRAAVGRDINAARAGGMHGTPTVLVNEIRFAGAPPRRVLDSLLVAASTRRYAKVPLPPSRGRKARTPSTGTE